MERWGPDAWAGLFVTIAGVVIGIPVLVELFSSDPVPPVAWWWTAAFVSLLASFVTASWLIELVPRRVVLTAFAVQVVLGPVVVLLLPRAGWLPILLVFTAALSVYLVPLRVTVGVAALNTAVVAVAAWTIAADLPAILLTALIYALLQLGAALSVSALERETAMRTKLSVAHAELRAATAVLAESTRAQERLRIARDLHDLIGHQLTALTLELEVAAHHSEAPAAEHVDRARRVARELLSDVRSTVGELRRTAPDLRESLTRVVADLPAPRIHLEVADDATTDDERAIALVRCVQEVVTNTIRHSMATNLWVTVATDDDGALRLTARDDGVGAGAVVPGHGLQGITERVEALGGSVRFDGSDGFRVAATVPAP